MRGAIGRVLPARSPGDDRVWASSQFHRVRWSLALIGFLVYIFVIVTYRLPLGDVGVGLALVGLLLLPYPFRFTPLMFGVAALYAWGWITYFTSPYPDLVVEELINLGKLLLILLVAVNVLRSRAEIRLYLILFLLFYAVYPARGTIFNYLGGYTHFGRALWNFVYANSNDLAAITLLVLSMAAGILITERQKWFRLGAFAAVIVLTVVILMTKSRGVFLGTAVFATFALLPNFKRVRGIATAGIILVGVFLLAPSDAFDRLGGLSRLRSTEDLTEVDPERSAEQRYAIWRVSWEIMRDHPITGVGWGAYPEAHYLYSPTVDPTGISRGRRDTHSTYFNLAAEVGLIGTILFGALVLGILLHAERTRRRCRELLPRSAQQLLYLELGLIGFLVAGIFGSYSKISFLYLHLGLIYSVTAACEEDLDRLSKGIPRLPQGSQRSATHPTRGPRLPRQAQA